MSIQVEIPLGVEESRMAQVKGKKSRRRIPNTAGRIASVPAKAAVNRPQQLLELAGTATRAVWGGIGLLADGELMEHLTFGISDQQATDLTRSLGFVPFIRFMQQRPAPTTLGDLAEASLDDGLLSGAAGDRPPVGSFLGVPLNCPGLYQGALYLTRAPEQPPFEAADETIVRTICGWLEQARLYDQTHLLTRLRLLNHVAQAASGSLDLERILAIALSELDRHLPLQMGAVWLIDQEKENRDQETRRPGDPETKKQGGFSPCLEVSFLSAAPVSLSRSQPVFDLSATSLALVAASAPSRADAEALGLEIGLRLRIEDTPFATCVSDGQAVYGDLRRPVERNSRLAENLAKGEATAYFAVPLRAGDRTVGVLQSICTRPSGFTNEQIQLLYLVADLLGPAISNCRLFERLSAAYDELRKTQTHLIQAEKMRALGELAAGMAHDFNNSLCAVLGFLELTLLDKGLPAVCRGYLESSRTCALDAAQTVHRVQDFARWQRNELTVEVVDPNELVQQTIELSRHKWGRLALAGENAITVEYYTEASANVRGSSAELRDVLTNLVFNAVDAMPRGGALVLRTWSTADDVFLSVQDSGIGIPDSVRHRIFEPYFTTKGERGNGMGLSASFGIVQRHGGEITVESVLNRGSTFTVRLPVVHESQGSETSIEGERASSVADSELSNSGPAMAGAYKSLRILIVEDEEHIRRFLAAGLAQLGHRPRVTASAADGLAAFNEEPFDVVLTDLGLPDLSGEEVARHVAERSPEIPVVLLTGWADQLKAETRPVAGVKYILGKPVTLNTLLDTLTTLCQVTT